MNHEEQPTSRGGDEPCAPSTPKSLSNAVTHSTAHAQNVGASNAAPKGPIPSGAPQEWWQTKVTVCDKCFQATCWAGQFMCEESQGAGIVEKTIAELIALHTAEHPDHWVKGNILTAQRDKDAARIAELEAELWASVKATNVFKLIKP